MGDNLSVAPSGLARWDGGAERRARPGRQQQRQNHYHQENHNDHDIGIKHRHFFFRPTRIPRTQERVQGRNRTGRRQRVVGSAVGKSSLAHKRRLAGHCGKPPIRPPYHRVIARKSYAFIDLRAFHPRPETPHALYNGVAFGSSFPLRHKQRGCASLSAPPFSICGPAGAKMHF